jgi:hypothetical protein
MAGKPYLKLTVAIISFSTEKMTRFVRLSMAL